MCRVSIATLSGHLIYVGYFKSDAHVYEIRKKAMMILSEFRTGWFIYNKVALTDSKQISECGFPDDSGDVTIMFVQAFGPRPSTVLPQNEIDALLLSCEMSATMVI